MDTRRLILASTSPYRVELLNRLLLKFEQIDPRYEELKEEHEKPASCALRLAEGKALALSDQNNALIIGSDQVAHLDNQIFGKPMNYKKAFQQLQLCSGRWLSFSTAVVVYDTANQHLLSRVERFDIRFRELSTNVIEDYLEIEKPFDCAGSIKAEALGITLIQEMRGKDVNTLYGLPLIALTDLLNQMRIST